MSMTVKIVLCCCCIFIFGFCCTLCQPQIVTDCCLSVKNKTLSKDLIVDYQRQVAGQGCSIDATILVTRRGKKLCAPADEPWVDIVTRHVDTRKTRKRCPGKRKNRRCGKMKKM